MSAPHGECDRAGRPNLARCETMLDTASEPQLGDAFGQALWHHHRGQNERTFEVIEREDGLISVNDLAVYFAEHDDWPTIERHAAHQVTGRVLDLGCGAGRHARPLTRQGFEVLGVDASPGAVAVAAQRGVSALVGSADSLPDGIGVFDTILLFGNNIGLLGGREQARRVLAELAHVSTPATRVLASGFDPHHTRAPEHLDYHRNNRARGRMPGQISMRVRHARLATPYFDYLLCSVTELADLLNGSPWQLSDVRRDDENYSYVATMTRDSRHTDDPERHR